MRASPALTRFRRTSGRPLSAQAQIRYAQPAGGSTTATRPITLKAPATL